MSTEPPQIRFKNNAIIFSELIADVITRAHESSVPITITPVLLNIAAMALKNMNPDTLIDGFIKKSSPHWEQMKRKDIEFFLHNGLVIFEGLPASSIADMNKLFVAKIYTPLDSGVTMSTDLYKMIDAKAVAGPDGAVVLKMDNGKSLTFKSERLVDGVIMEKVWTFFQASAKQSVSYIHFRRVPDPVTKKYSQTYYSEISIRKSVEMWEIKELK